MVLMVKKRNNDEFEEIYIEKLIDSDNLLRTIRKNGERYVGEHNCGIPNGKGKQTWPGGNFYIGSFKDGVRHGWGTYTHPSGIKETCYFYRAKPLLTLRFR